MPGPQSLSAALIDQYSIRLCVQSGLASNGWTAERQVLVKHATSMWPIGEEIKPPVVYVQINDSTLAGIELGSHGKQRDVSLHIFATNEPMKVQLAEEIVNLFRDDQVSILNFVTGNETSPESIGRYDVPEVGWRSVPMPASATDVDKWRSVVRATVRRIDA